MKDIPIIFSGPMVRSLLDGRKTMTRRLAWRFSDVNDNHTKTPTPWQKVKSGDRLWARETFFPRPGLGRIAKPHYRADPKSDRPEWRGLWRPSIHMPRWASRLTLIVTATKIERLQDISENDARAEGIEWDYSRDPFASGPCACRYGLPALDQGHARRGFNTAAGAFAELWRSLHGAESWDENPEVVALTFTVHKQNIDALAQAA